MLKMIIADDELMIRDSLVNYIPWNEFNIEVIGEACNGEEAITLCKELSPDILLTDIRMPVMDGLEVAMMLKEEDSGIKIIILSGVQDFNYAKTALDLNLEGYIIKPVNLSELKSVVSKVVYNIEFGRKKEHDLKTLKEQMHESLPLVRDKFLSNLISGVKFEKSKLEEMFAYCHLPLNLSESHIISIIQIDDYDNLPQWPTQEDKLLLEFSVINIVNEILGNDKSGICFINNENEFVVIMFEFAICNQKFIDTLEEILSNINNLLNISLTIGIGSKISDITKASISYREARTALEYRFYAGKNSILDITDINNIYNNKMESTDWTYTNQYNAVNQLIALVKTGNEDKVDKVIGDIFSNTSLNKSYSINYMQSLCVELICTVSRSAYEIGEDIESITGNYLTLIQGVYKTEDIYDLQDYLKKVFRKVSGYFSSKHNQKSKSVIEKIKDIINKKYTEQISTASIAGEVFLTPNYVSLIFKQETGHTITEYLTKVRMEEAKRLLKLTDMRILEISEKVGFENPSYFTSVFKKYTGLLPQKFRSNPDQS